MKKLLAVLMSVVMMFALVAMPVSAAEETAKEEITFDDVITTVETTINLIQDTLIQVHYIVGTILGILEKECPLCATIHEVDLESGELPDITPEAPEDAEAAA